MAETKEEQFKILYEKYFAPFCIYAKQFLQDQIVREDIVSDVFAKLWLQSEDFILREDTAVSYIKACVRNNCLNYLRHQAYETDYSDNYKQHAPIYAESPESIYTLDEMYKLLYDAIEKLPENYRKVFIESFLKQKKQIEIAEELNLSIKTVGRYQTQVIELLRKELKDYLPSLILLSIIVSK